MLTICGRRVGPGLPVYIVAELSANHNQDFDEALRLVEAAAAAGADAVKLQTYTADTLTIRCDEQPFRIGKGTIWAGRNLYDLYDEAYTPWEWQPRLKQTAEAHGLHLFSTPFDSTAVTFLEAMHVPAHKIASFELVDLALIREVAATGKPMIMSTGMATVEEIGEAVAAAREAGATQIALLKCTSAYPSPPEEMNLRTIPDLAARFDLPVGLSDHTLGIAVPVAAVALGACIIEKHFTISRAVPGPDSVFSLEPEEFTEMVQAVRTVERALGSVSYSLMPHEIATKAFRRSLFVVRDVAAGERLTEENVRSIRPGHGLPPRELPAVLGRAVKQAIRRGTPLSWDLLE